MSQSLGSKPDTSKGFSTSTILGCLFLCGVWWATSAYSGTPGIDNPLSIPRDDEEGHLLPAKSGTIERADFTLRDFLSHPDGYHLGMAPSFFGFYGYFGALAAWEDELSNETFNTFQNNLQGVTGASAGAMAAILLAAGIPPKRAAEFCTTISLLDFADFPGFLTVFRGNKFEKIMDDFLRSQHHQGKLLDLQQAPIPVAVSGFDLQTMTGRLLTRGSMARAARASACFPGLFQPVGWIDGEDNYLLVDGGIQDTSGLAGLAALNHSNTTKRVVNLVMGDFHLGVAPGPSELPPGIDASEVLSISLRNLPSCGPWAMGNGQLAVEAARQAMRASLDLPLFRGKEDGHYELHIDASSFVPT